MGAGSEWGCQNSSAGKCHQQDALNISLALVFFQVLSGFVVLLGSDFIPIQVRLGILWFKFYVARKYLCIEQVFSERWWQRYHRRHWWMSPLYWEHKIDLHNRTKRELCFWTLVLLSSFKKLAWKESWQELAHQSLVCFCILGLSGHMCP